MSQDIRSFFKPLNGTSAKKEVKKRAIIESSDEDVIEDSPAISRKKTKHEEKAKEKHTEKPAARRSPRKSPRKSPKKPNGVKKEVLKPVKITDLFSTAPVKQSKTPAKPKPVNNIDLKDEKKERAGTSSKDQNENKSKKRDEGFKKTLEELDQEDDFDANEITELDKTIGEVLEQEKNEEKKEKPKTPSSSRKRKADLNTSTVQDDEDRQEKRRYSALLYQKFKNRPAPAHKDEKEMPKGKPGCLKGLCFIKTGVLDSLDSESLDILVKDHGGRTVKSVSKKVHYILIGEEPGPAKVAKAHDYGIKEITEDELLDMILTKSGMEPKYVRKDAEPEEKMPEPETKKRRVESPKKEAKAPTRSSPRKLTPSTGTSSTSTSSKKNLNFDLETVKPESQKVKEVPEETKPLSTKISKTKVNLESIKPKESKKEKPEVKEEVKPLSMKMAAVEAISRPKLEISEDQKSWTEKYKPTSIKTIIGQQTNDSNMNKLLRWLANWNTYHGPGFKTQVKRPSPWEKNDNGAFFKCALLSGAPGMGKTTTATLVAQELGYDIVEFNASDTRNKKLLHEEISQLLSSKSIVSFFKDGSAPTSKHLLLMDEVDGMSGNQDRGGIQELIALIKSSNIPIICMCNDRQHQKIRSLLTYCYDLRFNKIRVEAIRGAMMSVCFKEGLQIKPDVLAQIITSTGNDIRQTLNHLSMWSASSKVFSEDLVDKDTKNSMKDTIMGNWEVIRKVFSAEEHKTMSTSDKAKLFFYDYSIGPLFVQENYLNVEPHCPKNKILERVALAADAISMGDVLESQIRRTNNWSLMESQAFYSSVLPGHYMSGHFTGQINFPGWLGKNSKRTKHQRIAGELQVHMRKTTSASKQAIILDYIYHLRDKIIYPMINNGTAGVPEAVNTMYEYNLLREDFDSLLELSKWSHQKDLMNRVESKVKAAFTRSYNKNAPVLPYSLNSVVSKKKSKENDDVYGDAEDDAASDEEEDDDIANDGMIIEKKKGKTETKAKASTSKGKASAATSSKTKGRKPK